MNKFRLFQKSLDIDDESLFAFTVGYQPRKVPEETRESASWRVRRLPRVVSAQTSRCGSRIDVSD